MPNQLTYKKWFRPLNAVAAGTSSQNGTGIDTSGADGVIFVASLGTLTAGQVTNLKAQQSSDDAGSDPYADITGAVTGNMADGDSNKLLILDVFRPQKKFVRPVLVRGTQNAVIDGITGAVYEIKKVPAVQSSNVSQSKFIVGA